MKKIIFLIVIILFIIFLLFPITTEYLTNSGNSCPQNLSDVILSNSGPNGECDYICDPKFLRCRLPATCPSQSDLQAEGINLVGPTIGYDKNHKLYCRYMLY